MISAKEHPKKKITVKGKSMTWNERGALQSNSVW